MKKSTMVALGCGVIGAEWLARALGVFAAFCYNSYHGNFRRKYEAYRGGGRHLLQDEF